MDMVVSRVRVLQESFIETAPAAPWEMLLGSGVPGPPSIRPRASIAPDVAAEVPAEGSAEGDFMDQIYDRKEASVDTEADAGGEGGAVEQGGDGEGDTVHAAQPVSDAASSDANALPVLTLDTINLFRHNSRHAYTPRGGDDSMQVTVVDDYSKIQMFAAAVRKLSHSASSSKGQELLLYLLLTVCF